MNQSFFTKTTILAALSTAGAALAQALGGWDMTLQVLLGFMAADYWGLPANAPFSCWCCWPLCWTRPQAAASSAPPSAFSLLPTRASRCWKTWAAWACPIPGFCGACWRPCGRTRTAAKNPETLYRYHLCQARNSDKAQYPLPAHALALYIQNIKKRSPAASSPWAPCFSLTCCAYAARPCLGGSRPSSPPCAGPEPSALPEASGQWPRPWAAWPHRRSSPPGRAPRTPRILPPP